MEKTESLNKNYDEVKTARSAHEVFSTASRERIIELEKIVEFHASVQNDEILPKIKHIELLCSEINLYNESEMEKTKNIEPTSPGVFVDRLTRNSPLKTSSHHQSQNIHEPEKESLELLVIGSSITKYIDAGKIERRSPENAITECMSGAKVEDVNCKIKEYSLRYNIKKIVIHVGGNNILNDNPKTLTEKIVDMLKEVRKIMPTTKIFYSAIIPRWNNNYLPGINWINSNIRAFCAENRIRFVPHYQFHESKYNINFKLLRKDGVHPSRHGRLPGVSNLNLCMRAARNPVGDAEGRGRG